MLLTDSIPAALDADDCPAGFRPNAFTFASFRDATVSRAGRSAAMTIDDVLALAPVLPTVLLDEPSHARPIAEALVQGGLRAVEVTLRSRGALESISEIAQVEGAVVGAGMVTSERQLDRAIAAGARFVTSPGLTDTFGAAAMERAVPFLPGVASAADIMRGLELGLDHFQIYPAEQLGLPMVRALAAPFPQCRFSAAGGMSPIAATLWLAEQAIACVSGDWLAPPGAPNLAEIERRAREAATLR